MTRIDASQVEGLPAASGGGYPIAIARHVLPAGTALGSTADDVWYVRDLNDLLVPSAWGASLANNTLTLPAGTYLIDWWIRYPPVRELWVGLFDEQNNWLDNDIKEDKAGSVFWRTPVGRYKSVIVLSQSTGMRIRAKHNYAVSGYPSQNKGVANSSPPGFDQTTPNIYSQIVAIKLA